MTADQAAKYMLVFGVDRLYAFVKVLEDAIASGRRVDERRVSMMCSDLREAVHDYNLHCAGEKNLPAPLA